MHAAALGAAMVTTDERVVLERLRMVRVAKDIFLSDWFRGSCDVLGFSGETCAELDAISRESAEERAELLALVERWARRMEPPLTADAKAQDVARVARRDFLLHMIDVKDASADAIERAGLLAPEGMKVDMMRLAALDVDHANRLRNLLVAEVQEAWSTRADRRLG